MGIEVLIVRCFQLTFYRLLAFRRLRFSWFFSQRLPSTAHVTAQVVMQINLITFVLFFTLMALPH